MKSVCVFCGSRDGAHAIYKEAARELGKQLAEKGIRLVYGAGNVGLMGELAASVLANGGEVYGAIPKSMVEREWAHKGITKMEVVETMHQRKAIMADWADAFIVLPGGIGTMEEFFEVWTWGQLGLHNKPYGILNVEGFYDPLIQFLRHMVEHKFIDQTHFDQLKISSNPNELLEKLGIGMKA
ncbi:MAG: TIGR00730 family Rossman fold protein [Verrucomicrobiota bacterium]|nr:TIGR00730 family Rossman fold protein [Verrucomicrobiota bacterium]